MLMVAACDVMSASILSRLSCFSAWVSEASVTTSWALVASCRIAVFASSTADMSPGSLLRRSVGVGGCDQVDRADPGLELVVVGGLRFGGCGGFRGRSGRSGGGLRCTVLVG